MLASACPGWVCFAEKTHPQSLPYISTAKSPQQVHGGIQCISQAHRLRGMICSLTVCAGCDLWVPPQIVGTLVKHVYAARAGVKPHDVYHATLMPCFDKKLV